MEKKTSHIAERIKLQQAKVLEHLAESGNISFACKRAGISRETFYRWRKDDEGFAEKADASICDGKEFVNDLAHSKLMQSINEGYFPAVKFQLVNCHKDYHPKKTSPPYHPEDNTADVSILSIPTIAKLMEYQEQLVKNEKRILKDSASK